MENSLPQDSDGRFFLRAMRVMQNIEPLKERNRDHYLAITEWKKSFKAAAIADNFALFRDHMKRLRLTDKPKLMLEGTSHIMDGGTAKR